ncbi:putative transcription factor AS2-LOB family [Medicago truncatula]|nr:putative transcription factor AS2-LOB family [Medicago truncatula]
MADISIPCGACKHLKRKCTNRCIFAPYFGKKQNEASFAAVHKVFGAGNVSKHLSTIPTNHHKKAMETITYEAQARISDPINGCVSTICALKKQVK